MLRIYCFNPVRKLSVELSNLNPIFILTVGCSELPGYNIQRPTLKSLQLSSSFSLLLHPAPFCSILLPAAPPFSLLLHPSPCYSILLPAATPFSLLLHPSPCCSILLSAAPSFSLLLHPAPCCSILLQMLQITLVLY